MRKVTMVLSASAVGGTEFKYGRDSAGSTVRYVLKNMAISVMRIGRPASTRLERLGFVATGKKSIPLREAG
jgi:hypothetical protein